MKGFTLIELMIVVAIMGILASVAIPAYQNHKNKLDREVRMLENTLQGQREYFDNRLEPADASKAPTSTTY